MTIQLLMNRDRATSLFRWIGLTTLAILLAGVPSAAQAEQAEPYRLSFTAGLGAYPRSAPEYEARTGAALSEGSVITGSCWVRGGNITNPDGYTSDIWVRDTSGLYWAEAWLDTGSYGVPAGLTECDVPATTVADEGPITYFGDSDLNYGSPAPMAYALYDHYLWGQGSDAVLDASLVAATPGFRDHVMSMRIGEFGTWRADWSTDLQLAVGTFTISRESQNCWAMYDWYDFQPNAPTSPNAAEWIAAFRDLVGYWPFWSYQAGGAKPFNVNSSGCF